MGRIRWERFMYYCSKLELGDPSNSPTVVKGRREGEDSIEIYGLINEWEE